MALEAVKPARQAVALENGEIQLMIRPDLGGRIDQLEDRKTGREWLWHPETYDASKTRSLPIGASFDDSWTGGWDEIFPNDGAGPFRGYNLVDHGELWSQAWELLEQSARHIRLAYRCQTVPVTVEKSIHLDDAHPQAQIDYRFQNHSDQTIPFLFKQHAAIAIEDGDEILLPDCWIEPAVPEFSTLIGRPEKTRFPKALATDGREIEVRYTPPRSSQLREFYYSSDLAVGQCGIRHSRSQSSLLMTFDTADFPYVWVFQSYGGWNGHYVLVLEPCTTMPYDLEVACRNGSVAQLGPHEKQHRRLTVQVQR